MRFEDLSWFDIQSYLEKDDRLMFVIGACEQHAYLSLLSDVKVHWRWRNHGRTEDESDRGASLEFRVLTILPEVSRHF